MELLDALHLQIAGATAAATAAVVVGLLARRLGVPVLLAFLGAGLVLGSTGLASEVASPDVVVAVGSLALAAILFDGGLRAPPTSGSPTLFPGAMLATVGVVLTAGILAAGLHLSGAVSWQTACLIGAAVSSTDAAAVFFLLRGHGLRLKEHIGRTLELESAANDPMAVFLTILAIEVIRQEAITAASALAALGQQAGLGIAFGVAGGWLLRHCLHLPGLPNAAFAPLSLLAAWLIYALCALAGGSGFLAVFLAGRLLATRGVPAHARLLAFHEGVAWGAQLWMFLLLGTLVSPAELLGHLDFALLTAGILMLVARPVAVGACLLPFGYGLRDLLFLSAMGLRGAIGIFLALLPGLFGIPAAQDVVNVAFTVVILSLLLQGWLAAPIARALSMAETGAPDPYITPVEGPPHLHEELIGYPVAAGAPVSEGRVLPPGARIVFAVRGDRVLSPEEMERPVPGDVLYLIAPATVRADLDRFFAAPQKPTPGQTILTWRQLMRRLRTRRAKVRWP